MFLNQDYRQYLSRISVHNIWATHVEFVVDLRHLESRISVESASARARNAACQAREGLHASAQQRGLHLEGLCDAGTRLAMVSISKNSRTVACTKEYKRRKRKLSERGETDERRLATGPEPARPRPIG